jgi:uncharacterized protein (DUF58 family)
VALDAYGALLDGVRGVRWESRRRVAGGPSGAHASTRRGGGAEFSEYRVYRQGDDPRRMDWRLLARTDRAYVRLADEQALLPTVIVVDASASLGFPAPAMGKWRQVCQIVVGLAAVAHGSGDPVGLMVAARDGIVKVAPRTRRGTVGEIASVLDGITPAGTQSVSAAVAASRAVRRGRVVIVSDFLGDDATGLLAGVEEGAAVHIVAREELDPPWGEAQVTDPEQPTVTRLLVGGTRAAYTGRFAAWREALAREIRADNAVYALVPTDEAPARAVRRIVGGGVER